MSRLSKKNEVFFFEPQEKLSFTNWVRLLKRSPLNGRRAENLTILNPPPGLPFLGKLLPKAVLRHLAPIIVGVNKLIFGRYVRSYLQSRDRKKTILWIYNPLDYWLVNFCPHNILVYYVYDETALFPQNRGISDTINLFDDKLSRRAAFIFASSELQRKKRLPLNPNTILIQNTADFDHFNRAIVSTPHIPHDLMDINKPIIGCSGFLGFQIDMELLLYIARKRPEWSLVLLGPDNLTQNKTYKKLASSPNVYFLGRKHHNDLPCYFRHFDVGLIPYDLSTHVTSAFPLRCFEYMACGIPVVSVAIDTLKPLGDLVHLCDTYEHFVSVIDGLLKTRNDDSLKRGVELVKSNSWDVRLEEISDAITRRRRHNLSKIGHPPSITPSD